MLSRLHFSPLPVFALGNWIPAVLYSWVCTRPRCGLAQAAFTSEGGWAMSTQSMMKQRQYSTVKSGLNTFPQVDLRIDSLFFYLLILLLPFSEGAMFMVMHHTQIYEDGGVSSMAYVP